MRVALRAFGLLWLLLCAISCPAQSRLVAVTFDDLPVVDTQDAVEARLINRAILDALDRHHAPAIGFVIGKRAEEIGPQEGKALLQNWVRRGYDLGSHTYSHPDLNDITADQFAQEVISNEPFFAPFLAAVGRSPRYLRFPYNHTGDTQAKHDSVAAFLTRRGYTVAPCTIDNEDDLFNPAYLAMLAAKDHRSARRLRAAYLRYTAVEIDYYASLHKQVFGREIPQVMLLHVSRLNADVIDPLLGLFERKQYHFVALDVALSDPAFSVPDSFVSKFGPMWGYRWASELNVRVRGELEPEPPSWITRYAPDPGKSASNPLPSPPR